MGSSASKALDQWSEEDLSQELARLGNKYSNYCTAIADNGIDGSIIAALTEQELEETLDDLGISTRLHRLVIRKKIATIPRRMGEQDAVLVENTPSKIKAETKEQEPVVLGFAVAEPQKVEEEKHDNDQQLLTEEDLSLYDDLVEDILGKTDESSIFYVGIHLIQEEGQLLLSGALRETGEEHMDSLHRWHFRPHRESLCSTLVRTKTNENFMKVKLSRMGMTYRGHVLCDSSGRRVGSVCLIEKLLRNASQNSTEDYLSFMREMASRVERQMHDKEDIIQRTAALYAQANLLQKDDAEPGLTHLFQGAAEMLEEIDEPEQVAKPSAAIVSDIIIEENGALLPEENEPEQVARPLTQRSVEKSTTTQRSNSWINLEDINGSSASEISEESSEPEQVSRNNLSDSEHALADVDQDSSTPGGILPTVPTKNSAEDSRFRHHRADSEEMQHLPADFFELHDRHGIPRPPIAKDDMQSIAMVEELNLHGIHPDSAIGKRLLQLVKLAAAITDCPVCFLNFHIHAHQYRIGCPVANQIQVDAMLENTGVGILRRVADGTPFSYGCVRAPAMCNYTLFLKKLFVVPDTADDASFRYMADMAGTRFYAAIPLLTADNLVLGTLSLLDVNPRCNFAEADLLQLEQLAFAAQQEIFDWHLESKCGRLLKSGTMLRALSNKSGPPSGEVTIVMSSVEGASALWERDPTTMQEALEIQDNVIGERLPAHHGYVVSSSEEGDYCLVFHDPVDAVQFALDCQLLLYEARWPQNLHDLPEASLCEVGCLRGLRVRMGIAQGRAICTRDQATGRIEYSGVTYNLAKSLEELARGGQILALQETWDLVSMSGGRSRGKFEVLDIEKQVLDLGKLVLCSGASLSDGIVAKSVVQIVPRPLSFNYFKDRKLSTINSSGQDPDIPLIPGRTFPSLDSTRQTGPSFHDAPYMGKEVTMMVVCTKSLAEEYGDQEARIVNNRLAHLLRELISCFGSGGYHCQDFMIAFDGPTNALLFGCMLLGKLREWQTKGDPCHLLRRIKIGCFQGEFASMGPHKTSGRAVYVGRIVDRAAHVASAAAPGTICFGTIVSPGFPIWVMEFRPPSFEGVPISTSSAQKGNNVVASPVGQGIGRHIARSGRISGDGKPKPDDRLAASQGMPYQRSITR